VGQCWIQRLNNMIAVGQTEEVTPSSATLTDFALFCVGIRLNRAVVRKCHYESGIEE
jgi:hypothetical protein